MQKKITPQEAAERAGVSLNLIYKLCAENRLPHYRIGGDGKRGCIRIEEADLVAFLEQCKREAGPTAAAAPALKHVTPRR